MNNKTIENDKLVVYNKYHLLIKDIIFDIHAIVICIINTFIVLIGIAYIYYICSNSTIDVNIMREITREIQELDKDKIGYFNYVYNIITGSTSSILRKNMDTIIFTIMNEFKYRGLTFGETAINNCSLYKSDNKIVNWISTAIQTLMPEYNTCVINVTKNEINNYFIEVTNSLSVIIMKANSAYYYIHVGIVGLMSSTGYLMFRICQIHNNKHHQNKIIKE